METKPGKPYLWLFWGLAILGLVLDQTTKYAIFASLYNKGAGGQQELITGMFRLTADFKPETDSGESWKSPLRTISGEHLPQVNTGALFGLGQRRNIIFTIISILAAVGIIYWSFRPGAVWDGCLAASLGLILAGTLGNLYDRFLFDGVRDFLHWYYWINWPVFNIADCCLVCGAGLLMIQALFFNSEETSNESNKAATTAKAEPITSGGVPVTAIQE